ncbi:MAG: ribosome recycling factor [Clostridiales bacterium]|nr:ribosome recycling factor [Clostridiales bacterium]
MRTDIHEKLEVKMNKTIGAMKDDLKSIRAGRANPSLLDRLSIDYYGSPTPINQLASVSAPEPRLIVVQPYDQTAIKNIEKAILQSDLGLNPSNDGKIIRLSIPQLTEERRKNLIKIAKKTAEEAKVALRNERRDANDLLKKMEKSNELTEDDLKKSLDEAQKLTDKFSKQIDDILVKKESEIMEV